MYGCAKEAYVAELLNRVFTIQRYNGKIKIKCVEHKLVVVCVKINRLFH